MHDPVNAFVETFEIEGAPAGLLSGLTFAAKDIYDVAGHVTGCGSPDWARTHPPAETHAAPVAALLAAGARLVGKTHTDEIAYSLMGANAHYGTPVNSRAPERVPGGSSSGSVAAVAAGLVDIGLGSDTGGSVRMPASFCGVWGIRPTHGRVAISGTMPLAPSFDTVGWFARDLALLARVTGAMGRPAAGPVPGQLLLPVDSWAAAEPATVDALAPALAKLEAAFGPARPVVLAPEGLAAWFDAFRVCQAAEVWQAHGDWVREVRPAFGPGVADRFAMAEAIGVGEWADARAVREAVRARMAEVLAGPAEAPPILVLPTSPAPAPLREADQGSLDDFRARALQLLCPAGLAGLPQISAPMGEVDGAPVGLGLVAAADGEGTLLAAAGAL